MDTKSVDTVDTPPQTWVMTISSGEEKFTARACTEKSAELYKKIAHWILHGTPKDLLRDIWSYTSAKNPDLELGLARTLLSKKKRQALINGGEYIIEIAVKEAGPDAFSIIFAIHLKLQSVKKRLPVVEKELGLRLLNVSNIQCC